MPDVLDQSEIDALLAAVERVGGKEPPKRGRREGTTRPHDFLRPERASKLETRAFVELSEALSREIPSEIAGSFGLSAECRFLKHEWLAYGEFLTSLSVPTCAALVDLGGRVGRAAVEISPMVLYPAIDMLLGGTGENVDPPGRPMTGLEKRLGFRLLGAVVRGIGTAWGKLLDLKPQVISVESNPASVPLCPPNETVAVAAFAVSFQGATAAGAGGMSMCIPSAGIAPLIEAFKASGRRGGGDAASALIEALKAVRLRLEVYAARKKMSVREISALSAGELIRTEETPGGPLSVEIEGLPKFKGVLDASGPRRAVRIGDKAQEAPAQQKKVRKKPAKKAKKVAGRAAGGSG